MKRTMQIAKGAHRPSSPFAPIEKALEAIRAGQIVIVVDDADRENEGDLTIAAEKVTPEAINFMARYGRGLVCLSMTPERLDELEIPLMVSQNSSRFDTAFCVSVEAKARTSTGISAADRAANHSRTMASIVSRLARRATFDLKRGSVSRSDRSMALAKRMNTVGALTAKVIHTLSAVL